MQAHTLSLTITKIFHTNIFMELSSFDLVIFDLDGTLIDTEVNSLVAFQKALEKQRVYITHDILGNKTTGLSMPDCIEIIKKLDIANHIDAQRVARDWIDIGAQRILNAPKEHFNVAGAKYILKQLFDNNIKCAIATNSVKKNALLKLENSNLRSVYPDLPLYSFQDVNDVGKPEPDLLLHVAEQFNTPARKALMVGNTNADMQSANRARMKSLGFTGCSLHPHARARELASYGAHHIIHSFNDFPNII